MESIESNSNNNDLSTTTPITETTETNTIKKQPYEGYFKLPSDVKIKLLDDLTKTTKSIGKLYKSLVSKMVYDKKEDNSKLVENLNNLKLSSSNNNNNNNNINNSNNNDLILINPICSKEFNDMGLEFVIGFDVETRSNGEASLIQLSTLDKIYLIRMCKFENSSLPKILIDLLQDPRILKVGVAVSQDAHTIFSSTRGSCVIKGTCDLVPLAKLTNMEGNGLAALTKSVMESDLNKSNHIRCGNWSADTLSPDQIHYAALDAWIGKQIFHKLFSKFLNLSTDPYNQDIYTFTKPFINTQFKVKSPKSTNPTDQKDGANTIQSDKIKKLNVRRDSIPDQRVLYDNCLMLSPNDVLLCNISKRKVQWYVERGLAKIVNEDPLSIKLNFEPKGQGNANDEFYLANKDNICVVCGSSLKILRHSIVPHSYRQYFPIIVKSHASHDIVLLCFDCHTVVDKRAQLMRMVISSEYGIPLDLGQPYLRDPKMIRINNCASILKQLKFDTQQKSKEYLSIPTEIILDMEQSIKTHLKKDEYTASDLINIMKANKKVKNPDYISHEKLVMDKVLAEGEDGMSRFIKIWRKNFIETAQPKFLCQHWSIDKTIIME